MPARILYTIVSRFRGFIFTCCTFSRLYFEISSPYQGPPHGGTDNPWSRHGNPHAHASPPRDLWIHLGLRCWLVPFCVHWITRGLGTVLAGEHRLGSEPGYGPLRCWACMYACTFRVRSSRSDVLPTSEEYKWCIPLRAYGDGAEAQQHFEILSILPLMSCSSATLDSRILVNVRNTTKTASSARRTNLEVLAWSFSALRGLQKT